MSERVISMLGSTTRLCFVVLFVCIHAHGATVAAASCSIADVETAYTAASAGDTVTVPAGRCTWSSKLTIAKALVLSGAGSELTIIRNNDLVKLIDISVTSDVAVRITGFTFDTIVVSGGDKSSVFITGSIVGAFNLTQIRIDGNRFYNGKRAIFSRGWVYGVINGNTFWNCDIAVHFNGDDNYTWARAITAGSANALFVEDNVFILDNANASDPDEQIYQQNGGRSVVRYNTFDGTLYTSGNSLFYDTHGNQDYYDGVSDFRGQPIVEVYGNIMKLHNSYQFFGLRGGSMLIYDNVLTQTTGSATRFKVTEEESWQSAFFTPLDTTWSAEDQINNSFFWGNTYNGAAITTVTLGNALDAPFIVSGQDYFMARPAATGGSETWNGRSGGAITYTSTGAQYFSLSAPTNAESLCGSINRR